MRFEGLGSDFDFCALELSGNVPNPRGSVIRPLCAVLSFAVGAAESAAVVIALCSAIIWHHLFAFLGFDLLLLYVLGGFELHLDHIDSG